MQTLKTITFFATVSNSASSRTSKNGRNYTAFGVSILSDDRRQTFHYNVVAFGKQVTSPSRCRKARASNSSSRLNLSPITSRTSRFSQQPSCGRFVRLHEARTKARQPQLR